MRPFVPTLLAFLILSSCGPGRPGTSNPQTRSDRFVADTDAITAFFGAAEGKWSGSGRASDRKVRIESRFESVDVAEWKESRTVCSGALCTASEKYFTLSGDHLLVGSRPDGTDVAPVVVLASDPEHLSWVEEIHPEGHRIEATYQLSLSGSSVLDEQYQSRDNGSAVASYTAQLLKRLERTTNIIRLSRSR